MGNSTEISRHTNIEAPIRHQGVLTILAGPTASGKSNVLEGLLDCYPNMKKVISITTRPARTREVDGIDYHFLTPSVFEHKVQQGGFLETVQYGKNFYGTQLTDIEPVLCGQDLVWIVNMGRAIEIGDFYKKAFSAETAQALIDRTVLLLIGTPSLFNLRERFKRRGSSDDFVSRIREDWEVWQNNRTSFQNILINQEGQLQETIASATRLIEERRGQLK